MGLVCLDMEGVLTPEIWFETAKLFGIPELEITTKDEPDYDRLMKRRISILKDNNIGIDKIADVISEIEPLEGAKDFLDSLRRFTQVIIVSDTFYQFAMPLMEKLGFPALFANSLEITDGMITGYSLRTNPSKVNTVRALKSIGFKVISSGDSYNDIGMIKESDSGFLFRTNEKIRSEYPEIPAFYEYEDLFEAIKRSL